MIPNIKSCRENEKLWPVCLLFLKTIFCSQKQGEQEKQEKHVWFPVFFFSSEKHKNTKFKEQISVFNCVFKNYSQE